MSVPAGDDTYVHRGRLPHLEKRARMYFVTFCTKDRLVLSPEARDHVIEEGISGHEVCYWLDCMMVMPDHVHLIVMPYEATSLPVVLSRIKGVSSYRVNRLLARSGPLWQRESFDRIVRSDENLAKKREYIFNNPVRAGIVERAEDYRWYWSPYGGAAGFSPPRH